MTLTILAVILLLALLVGAGLVTAAAATRPALPSPQHPRAGIGWRAVVDETARGAGAAVMRFPISILFLLLLALRVSDGISDGGPEQEEVLLALAAAAGAAVAGVLFGESHGWSWMVRQGAGLVLAAAAAALAGFAERFDTLLPAFAAALFGLMAVAPYLGRGSSLSFWMFLTRCAFAGVLAGAALLLFAGGLSAILASLSYLFGLAVPENIYGHVWTWSGIVAAPVFALGQVPRDFDAIPETQLPSFARLGLHALGDFVAAPLLLVYAVILHAYALKIVLTGDLPQGQIGWMVIVYGCCLLGALAVVHPFLESARAPSRLLSRVWPLLLPVPLVLLFVAAAQRIGDYGVTPERYLLVLFGGAAAILVLAQALPSLRADLRWMVAVPALALLAASFGPQGAVATSVRSQTDRFLALVDVAPLTPEDHDSALSALRFLSEQEALAAVTPASLPRQAEGEPSAYRRIAIAYGLDPDRPAAPRDQQVLVASYGQDKALAVAGFDLVVPSAALSSRAEQATAYTLPAGGTVRLHLEEGAVVVTRDTLRAAFPFDPWSLPRGGEAPSIELEADGRRLLFVPNHVFWPRQAEEGARSLTGTLFLRSADWSGT